MKLHKLLELVRIEAYKGIYIPEKIKDKVTIKIEEDGVHILLKNENTNIPFKCPYGNFSCLYVDTCQMSVEKSCLECEKNMLSNKK